MAIQYYRRYSQYLREEFGEKVYRICLDAGFSCPNRDGTLGTDGCAYCAAYGSWGSRGEPESLERQVHHEIERVSKRYGARKFIAYFQAYTNTYAPPELLKKIYDTALGMSEDIVGLAIGTRPDCIDNEKLNLIEMYKKRGYAVWIEYGLQSANDATLKAIGRGHTVRDFRDAVLTTGRFDIPVTAHVIIGLPGEGRSDIIATADFLADLPIHGIKIHNLNIVKGTRMEAWYRRGQVRPLELGEYADLVVDFLERTHPDVVIERIAAETPPVYLIAPLWSSDKQAVIRSIVQRFDERKSRQGMLIRDRKEGAV
jgi:radical SAM protein (TIGR01212 family)